ncbi:MAG: primosomal protein N' [Ruminococcaceae bacterium]|nr:primosomal protein N' [Oscillospiraceae bacterium]
MVAEVVLNLTSRATDRIFHYSIPEHLTNQVCTGVRVVVPFGRGNRTNEGYVMRVVERCQRRELKSISSVMEGGSLFDEKAVELITFMHHRYFCTYAEAIKALLPAGVSIRVQKLISLICQDEALISSATAHSLTAEQIISILREHGTMELTALCELIGKKNINATVNSLMRKGILSVEDTAHERIRESTVKLVFLTIERSEAFALAESMQGRAPAQARVMEMLCENENVQLSELLEFCQTTHATLNKLKQKGYLDWEEIPTDTGVADSVVEEEIPIPMPTPEQEHIIFKVCAAMSRNETNTFLLRGVTGSGKTEVYLRLIEECISQGKQAIFLVPEIALTPQMVRQVVARFGESVAVLHSALTIRQRFDEWMRIKNGSADVVIGARSAVFAPLPRLGLVVMDEEHENTYKSESSPRYHAREIARLRVKQNQAVLLLASATPAVESTYLAQCGKYIPLTLNQRINDVPLPKVTVADMRLELQEGNRSIFSRALADAIEENLSLGQQTILFLNRRGYSSFVSCRSCGYVAQCPNCNISLTYHRTKDHLVCHYCDYKTNSVSVCPGCGSKQIRHFGIGTQKVVDELATMFPQAKVLRMDADTTSGRMSHERILKQFRDEKIDILVGTQMVTKGLDFESVTLVGVLAADMTLYMDDYRSDERTFDLITQVCGRAGRGRFPGRAIIQTYNPESDTILLSKKQDYPAFYEKEIRVRHTLNYPPFCELITITFSDAEEKKARSTATGFHNALEDAFAPFGDQVELYKNAQAPMFKLNGKYRYRFLIKTRYNREIYDSLHLVYEKFCSRKDSATVLIDVNPQNML